MRLTSLFTFFALALMPLTAQATCFSATLTGGPKDHPLLLEIAETNEARATGLMFRTSLPDDRGMLFLFPELAPWAFWMQNTYIDLDIAHIREDGFIMEVLHGKAEDETMLWPREASKRVLEVRAGLIEETLSTHLEMGAQVACPATNNPK